MDLSLEEAMQRGGGPIRRGDKGKGSSRPSPYGKGGGRGGSKGGGFSGGGKGGGGKNVYVGNLTWTVSWQDLKDHFKTIGPVLNADVMQEPDGRSKGCGLVKFATAHGQTLVVLAAAAAALATYPRLGALLLAHGGSLVPRAELRRLGPLQWSLRL